MRRRRSGRRATVPVTVVLLLSSLVASGCIRELETYYGFEPDDHYVNPGVFPGNYQSAEAGSSVLEPRRFVAGDPEVYRLASALPHSAVSGSAEAPAESTVFISMAVWIPTNGTRSTFPVIAVAGPYFEQRNRTMMDADDEPAPFEQDPKGHPAILFLLRNFLPLGYAVAAIGVRGTGTSGGCMELLGQREAADLDQAIRFLAQQPWSNGNVAMYGREYEGATPWLVAAQGNEHLKTIVTISGFPDLYSRVYHNGSAEVLAPLLHPGYWFFGINEENNAPPRPSAVPEPGPPVPTGTWIPPFFGASRREAYQDRQNVLCDEAYEGFVAGASATTGADRRTNAAFWDARDYRGRTLANYDGSVFLIHGLQDWYIDPHTSIPFNQALRSGGIEVKEWYGQWLHGPPDGRCLKDSPKWSVLSCRGDYAETLRHWFEYYLQENRTMDRGPWVQVEDSRGHWRNAPAFPPTNPNWVQWGIHGNRTLGPGRSPPTTVTLAPPLDYGSGIAPANLPRHVLEFKGDPVAVDTRISGHVRLELPFEAKGPGGLLAAWLFDENAEGKVFDRWLMSRFGLPPIIGHAQMDLRYHAGGDQASPLVPGTRYTARMEFEPLDVFLPAGHRLTLWIQQYPYPDHMLAPVPSPVDVIVGGEAKISLPLIDVAPNTIFPVPGAAFPDPKYWEWTHVRKPDYPELVSLPPSRRP